MKNEKIIRNRLKIKSAIINAQQFINIQKEYGSFDSFIWSYVDNKPIENHFDTEGDIPAYMQAIGIVNDHVKSCHLYKA